MFSTLHANFTRFTSRHLSVSKIIHKCFVEVKEEGTEAAAATVVVLAEITSIFPVVMFHCNKPFIFLLMDNQYQNLLFMGAFQDPRT
ncbi:hypothetical protein Pmani_016448 [Petrolisthes manimaculis]|uniref:Serpin domain-containing protein n=1 Tax=Petrolisthes manimaculis TaxID=1843537 RepID=A0AAE1UB03_9EUCA|nr:hypothetical protein Pmani_016448 [Petrolisthes manimaculis]